MFASYGNHKLRSYSLKKPNLKTLFLKNFFICIFLISVNISGACVCFVFSIPLIFCSKIFDFTQTHTQKLKEGKNPLTRKKKPAGFGSTCISNHAITEPTCSIGTFTISWLRPNFRNIEININDGIRIWPIHADYKKVIQKEMFFSSITCIEIMILCCC